MTKIVTVLMLMLWQSPSFAALVHKGAAIGFGDVGFGDSYELDATLVEMDGRERLVSNGKLLFGRRGAPCATVMAGATVGLGLLYSTLMSMLFHVDLMPQMNQVMEMAFSTNSWTGLAGWGSAIPIGLSLLYNQGGRMEFTEAGEDEAKGLKWKTTAVQHHTLRRKLASGCKIRHPGNWLRTKYRPDHLTVYAVGKEIVAARLKVVPKDPLDRSGEKYIDPFDIVSCPEDPTPAASAVPVE